MSGIGVDKAEAATLVQKPPIVRETRPGIDINRISFPTHKKFHVSLRPIRSEGPSELISTLAGLLKRSPAFQRLSGRFIASIGKGIA